MKDIKWKDGAVCFANGLQHIANGFLDDVLLAHSLTFSDFQLNEIRIGDYIPESELGTEKKYNEAVEVFKLFGFEWSSYLSWKHFMDSKYTRVYLGENRLLLGFRGERKLTYTQLMAIGNLKRAEIGRDNLIKKIIESDLHLTTGFIKPHDSEVDSSGDFRELKKAVNSSDFESVIFYSNRLLGTSLDDLKYGNKSSKASRAYNLLESMNISYDEEKEKWYKKEYL